MLTKKLKKEIEILPCEVLQEMEDFIKTLKIKKDMKEAQKVKPLSLYGIWKGKFPEEFDLDKELYEIRSGWKKNLEDING
ncbi:MAG: DUF2281 domain-containing protein [Nitrospinae bacterium]|nr:DUF2281 domain-containing protein [Nitrospinota bacterium]